MEFTCNCCHQRTQAQEQPSMIPDRAPLVQVECLTDGCANQYWTYTWQAGGDNAQVLSRYTPIQQEAKV